MNTLLILTATFTAVSVAVAIPVYSGQSPNNNLSHKAKDSAVLTAKRPTLAEKGNPFSPLNENDTISFKAENTTQEHQTHHDTHFSTETIYQELLSVLKFTDVESFRRITDADLYREIRSWAITNPEFAMQWLTTVATPEQQKELELFILHSLLPLEIAVVFDAREALVLPQSGLLVDREYANSLAKTDAPGAFEWALQRDNKESRKAALTSAAIAWARLDHHSLLARLALITDAELSQHIFNSATNIIVAKLINNEPSEALAWAATLTSQKQQTALPAIFSKWMQLDSLQQQAARLWLQQQPESPSKSLMIENDFWISLSSNNERDLDHAQALFAQSLTQHEYAESLVYGLTTTLMQKRSEDVELFISSLSDQRLIKSAGAAQREHLMHQNPEEYLNLVHTIDKTERIPFLATVLYELEKLEPKLVRQWLESNPVSIQEMKLVAQQIKKYKEDQHRC